MRDDQRAKTGPGVRIISIKYHGSAPIDLDVGREWAPRARRTASALWRCAGQATTPSERGKHTAACAIPQAAVVVLPHWRAVSARMEAPRGAVENPPAILWVQHQGPRAPTAPDRPDKR